MRQPTSPIRMLRTELRPIEQSTMKGGPPSATFAAWSERLQVYDEYIAALAKYKRETALAERARAEAGGGVALARSKSVVIKELETYGRLLHKVRLQQSREATLATERGERALKLLAGRRIVGSLAAAWSCYAWFESRALLEAADELYAVRLSPDARAAECFFDNRDESLVCEAAPRQIDTALGLATWLHKQSYLPRTRSAAHAAMTKLFEAINGVAVHTLEELHAALADIRSGTFLAWRPRIVLGITPSAVAARIELAGASRMIEHPPVGSRRVPKPHHRSRNTVSPKAGWVGIVGDQA